MKKFMFIFALAASAALFTACGKDKGGGGGGAPATVACAAGMVRYGTTCLSNANCLHMGTNYGWNGSTCVAGTLVGSVATTTGLCTNGMVRHPTTGTCVAYATCAQQFGPQMCVNTGNNNLYPGGNGGLYPGAPCIVGTIPGCVPVGGGNYGNGGGFYINLGW